jgi:hypothetical protein
MSVGLLISIARNTNKQKIKYAIFVFFSKKKKNYPRAGFGSKKLSLPVTLHIIKKIT